MDPPCSVRVPRARTYSRAYDTFRLQGFHLLRRAIQALHSSGAASAFARRYSRSRCCFPFLWVLRCFSSPRSLHAPMHSVHDDHNGPGFPIRRSRDHGLVTGSLGLIAGSYVLHRLSTPRHPPCALGRLITPTRCRDLTPQTNTGPCQTNRTARPRQRASTSANDHSDATFVSCSWPDPGGSPDQLATATARLSKNWDRAGSPGCDALVGVADAACWRGEGILATDLRSSRAGARLSCPGAKFWLSRRAGSGYSLDPPAHALRAGSGGPGRVRVPAGPPLRRRGRCRPGAGRAARSGRRRRCG